MICCCEVSARRLRVGWSQLLGVHGVLRMRALLALREVLIGQLQCLLQNSSNIYIILMKTLKNNLAALKESRE